MGEVYKAKDTRLDRTVAIKVLPSHLSDNARLKERFEREARAVSSLNHPHICTLYDIGTQDGIDFLVMEYLEGETLADRLTKGRLPLDQALRHAIEIADGLDKAHRQGVAHRDLKPGNIMLTKSGAKLLDFGLAKQFGPDAGPGLSALPTAEKPLTDTGAIVGTLQYMSPEQLEGKEADARTDIFAFGAVLYETVTGRKAFEGKSQASLIGAIMEHDPPAMSTLQSMSPPLLDHVVRRCLVKEPDGRWQSASDLMGELKWIAEGGSEAGVPSVARAGRRISPRLALGIAIVSALLTGITFWSVTRSEPTRQPITRFPLLLPPGDQLTNTGRHVVALSPDGTHLVYVANRQLFLRNMDQMVATPIRGTESRVTTGNTTTPFFSPDGQWIGFFLAGRQLKKVSVSGGAPVTLCEAAWPVGASWGADDTILFGQPEGIMRVSANGGNLDLLVGTEEGEQVRGPQMLPDGESVLFTIASATGPTRWDEAQIVVQLLESGERKILWTGGSDARYVPTGHLVYALEDVLFAVPFDLANLEVTGGPVPIVEDVMTAAGTGAAQFSFSDTGSLVYVPEDSEQAPVRTLVWVSRQGAATPLTETRRAYRHPRISPDGERLAVTIQGDIWVLELARDTLTRLTFEGGYRPIWTPDGETVTFGSGPSAGTGLNIFSKPVDGSAEAEQLTSSEAIPSSWSPDGKMLVFRETTGRGSGRNVGVLRLDGEPEIVLGTEFRELHPVLSPDGRWLAYTSDESGRTEVYVQPFPEPGEKSLVSTEGGSEPMWNPHGGELFYRNGDGMWSVAVSTEPAFRAAKPVLLFEGEFELDPWSSNYDVAPDGRRFVMIRRGEDADQQLNVVLNWFEELKRLVPTDN
jgi:Tol biopolymer transport system component